MCLVVLAKIRIIFESRCLKNDKTVFIFDFFAMGEKQVWSFFFIFASLCSVKLGCIREPKVIGHEVGKIKYQNKFWFSAHLHYFCGQKLLTNY